MPTPLPLADIGHELGTTRRLLERVPDEHLSWRPHERSWTLGELATHIVNLLYWQTSILRDDHYDLAAAGPPLEAAASRDALLERFDQLADVVRQSLAATDEEALTARWQLRRGDHVMIEQPRGVALRTMGVSHMVHHRGQLSVYLRLLDVPLPAMYGPTADEAA